MLVFSILHSNDAGKETILSDQSVVHYAFTSLFGLAFAYLEPRQKWYQKQKKYQVLSTTFAQRKTIKGEVYRLDTLWNNIKTINGKEFGGNQSVTFLLKSIKMFHIYGSSM